MLTVETRHAIHPDHAKGMDTAGLREHFLGEGLFADGEIRLIYTHYDRFTLGGAVPAGGTLTLDKVEETKTDSFLDRREMGIVNIGETGTVEAGGETYEMNRGDVLYLGMGTGAVTFGGAGRFYITSAPAHRALPSRLVTVADCVEVNLGAAETSNKRTIKQFIHPQVMESCQLILGYTSLEDGSVWNTIPAHIHDRRMEAYLYWGMDEEARVLHLMGKPDETRHMFVANEQAVISPTWSIHSGAGIGEYTFIWAMAGDNVDYTDMEFIQPKDMR
ncbi:MAG: 5-dehydro-4-deoxy-D-glucuronate isomerase [Rhodobacteraceae bacterium]|jgi:4-deoxy-L-threo-5-hexosulose-uronate ketol-isomerase|uniref:4-deoxy-L-threo-5-hexosulose-uronate ketol-isomerase n=1 Tax=Salipiger profundus TaxID=1229727 RepID=A0A1U7DCK0_9RHOB|nr:MULTISPECIES: 5-dehydro-4-deoxy-D-glucuronate isomerase [Salipiger]APX25853.1 4-deoxy-L-threo-5-hexosulose-uronate ketol-isomerase [Salipiger profundus]MAB05119.1 5-dehydro-4-deoxy-D-glucuronate isomerase [Paracoccaceae bacterium]SFC80567.1 4-deoxy-L-threo-5-hexosulose-uronate ketol-isomerase [Salipiger profundus]